MDDASLFEKMARQLNPFDVGFFFLVGNGMEWNMGSYVNLTSKFG